MACSDYGWDSRDRCNIPSMTRYAIDNFVAKGSVEGLWLFAAVYGLLVLIQALNVKFMAINSGRIETGVVYDIRRKGFDNLQNYLFHIMTNLGRMDDGENDI